MIHYELFSQKQGSGYISNSYEEMEDACFKEDVSLAGGVLLPGSKYDLNGFFNRQMTYLGKSMLEEKGIRPMIFYMGTAEFLHYFQAVWKVTETRIYLQYAPNSGRDYNFVNGKWK